MKIELKAIKICKWASQETLCYTANVYIDGKKAFTAENDGHGGSDNYRDYKNGTIVDKAAQWVASQNTDEDIKDWSNVTLLELYIGDLLNDHIFKKDIKRQLKRVTVFEDGKIYQYKNEFNQALIPSLKRQIPNGVILNTLPLDEVRKYYEKAGLA